jgi:hypothetical protein
LIAELGGLGPGGEGPAMLDRVAIAPLDQEMTLLLTSARRGKHPFGDRHRTPPGNVGILDGAQEP